MVMVVGGGGGGGAPGKLAKRPRGVRGGQIRKSSKKCGKSSSSSSVCPHGAGCVKIGPNKHLGDLGVTPLWERVYRIWSRNEFDSPVQNCIRMGPQTIPGRGVCTHWGAGSALKNLEGLVESSTEEGCVWSMRVAWEDKVTVPNNRGSSGIVCFALRNPRFPYTPRRDCPRLCFWLFPTPLVNLWGIH